MMFLTFRQKAVFSGVIPQLSARGLSNAIPRPDAGKKIFNRLLPDRRNANLRFRSFQFDYVLAELRIRHFPDFYGLPV
jgi:hypothetical protein